MAHGSIRLVVGLVLERYVGLFFIHRRARAGHVLVNKTLRAGIWISTPNKKGARGAAIAYSEELLSTMTPGHWRDV